MPNDPFFWLHIKKSAGSRIRTLLQPHYVEVDRAQKPITFIQANPEQYNDILNNYRVVLGDHQFKRCLFAKKYLYPHNWDNIYSFAFSREPVDRCVSMFHYLYWRKPHVAEIPRALNKLMRGRTRKLELNASFAFDAFLDYAEQARMSDSIYRPFNNHFTTHTAPMWDDITDFHGNILLTEVFRIEALTSGINKVFSHCGIDKKLKEKSTNFKNNSTKKINRYNPKRRQIKQIEKIYSRDFEVYENASF